MYRGLRRDFIESTEGKETLEGLQVERDFGGFSVSREFPPKSQNPGGDNLGTK